MVSSVSKLNLKLNKIDEKISQPTNWNFAPVFLFSLVLFFNLHHPEQNLYWLVYLSFIVSCEADISYFYFELVEQNQLLMNILKSFWQLSVIGNHDFFSNVTERISGVLYKHVLKDTEQEFVHRTNRSCGIEPTTLREVKSEPFTRRPISVWVPHAHRKQVLNVISFVFFKSRVPKLKSVRLRLWGEGHKTIMYLWVIYIGQYTGHIIGHLVQVNSW